MFVDVTVEAGITHVSNWDGEVAHMRQMSFGSAVSDYDNDGYADMYLCTGWGYPNELYHNNGDGTFTEVGAAAGVASTKESMGALFFDYDNDGYLDLFVGNNGDAYKVDPPETIEHELYHNLGDGTFEEVTVSAGIPSYPNLPGGYMNTYPVVGGLAAGDIDGDGDLDLYIAIWAGLTEGDVLLCNDGDGTFTDISSAAGIDLESDSWAPMFVDVNRDGLLDIHVAVDFTPDRMFINNGDAVPTFTDMAPTYGIDWDWSEMGVTFADYDNDGDLDFYTSDIERPYGEEELQQWSQLFRNDSSDLVITFTEVARDVGVARGGWGWGTVFFDYDHDGWLDLAANNGFPWHDYEIYDPSKFWRNDGDGSSFTDLSDAVGFNDTREGRSLTAFDYDRDGDLDLMETNYPDDHDAPEEEPRGLTKLYRNEGGNARNWVVVDPVICGGGNANAIGAEVYLDAGDLHVVRLISAGNSYLSQEPDEAHFGLADATSIDLIRVRWPDGSERSVANQPVNTIIVFRNTVTSDANGDGLVDGADIEAFIEVLISGTEDPLLLCRCDVDGDGTVDDADIDGFVACLLAGGCP